MEEGEERRERKKREYHFGALFNFSSFFFFSLVQIARKLNNKTNDESSNTENWTTEEVMELLCSATHILNGIF